MMRQTTYLVKNKGCYILTEDWFLLIILKKKYYNENLKILTLLYVKRDNITKSAEKRECCINDIV